MKGSVHVVSVDLGDRSYDIRIGSGGLAVLGEACRVAVKNAQRVLVVSDTHVAPLYMTQAVSALEEAGFEVTTCVLPAGEGTKAVAYLTQVWEAAVEARLDRKSLFVALGGGVIGDLCGFAAASYLRGVPFVQVPTSLLAMVDSSVGGKTGMNLPQGKNLIGAFHQPNLVVADLSVLGTLSEREQHAGMAEVIKYGMISDADLFAYIEDHVVEIRALDEACMSYLVRRSCEIKADVVKQDEREGGVRAILNYGHTLGHAIENVCGYGEWLHGEAISAGMVYASRLSERLTGLDREVTERLVALFKAFDLPVTWQGLAWDPILKAMTADKKAENANPRFVLGTALGSVTLPRDVNVAELKALFEEG
jgi:3-dehydroquinate synthase